MEILDQLHLNGTFFIQFVIFAFSYFALSNLVFKPYSAALEARENRTKGGEDLAFELQKKAEELRQQYEVKARQVSGNVKTIFDEYRLDANKEFESIVSAARKESQALVEAARQKVSVEIGDAKAKLQAEVPAVAQEISKKLLSK